MLLYVHTEKRDGLRDWERGDGREGRGARGRGPLCPSLLLYVASFTDNVGSVLGFSTWRYWSMLWPFAWSQWVSVSLLSRGQNDSSNCGLGSALICRICRSVCEALSIALWVLSKEAVGKSWDILTRRHFTLRQQISSELFRQCYIKRINPNLATKSEFYHICVFHFHFFNAPLTLV